MIIVLSLRSSRQRIIIEKKNPQSFTWAALLPAALLQMVLSVCSNSGKQWRVL
jgi:hypothetical protein